MSNISESKKRIPPRKFPSGVIRTSLARSAQSEPQEAKVSGSELPIRQDPRLVHHHEKFRPRVRSRVSDPEESESAADQVPAEQKDGEKLLIWHDYQRGLSYPEQQRRESRRFRIMILAGGGIALAFVLLSLFR